MVSAVGIPRLQAGEDVKYQKASGFCLESDAEKAWRFGITSETVSPVSGNFVYVDQSMIVIYPYHPGLGMVVDSNRRRKFYRNWDLK
jgi:hypothetical protein